ncbi:alpha/beta hydrolase [Pandoraea terrae]|uniref:Alpha/beta hydrolase n=1 Tax=Pandoraea terrae TaxID=1537710 RepID=A0A5E4RBZ2_9BURK|nr:alpha/beta fold hydrolase [Pandoraea terrae]VVD60896.1 alpha/beta hydrolase [Pandoraea terrae]
MQAQANTVTPDTAAASLAARLAAFPYRTVATAAGTIGYRMAGEGGVPVVLLHGIGSGAASWLAQFEAPGLAATLYAWDAPGYGGSTPVAAAEPQAEDYAAALNAWLTALGLTDVVLVGHSLGAIMAASFAKRWPQRVRGLFLCSPAAGYGRADATVRAGKRDARLAMLAALGPEGMAAQRSDNLVAPEAGEQARAWVKWNMARILPEGYRQATHLLANADLAEDLAAYVAAGGHPVAVAVGASDAVTPPGGCGTIADAAGVPLRVIDHAGHASYIEAPELLNALLAELIGRVRAGGR